MKSPTFIKSLHNNFKEEIINNKKSLFIFEPLNTGLGHTIGNSIRRTLLSRIEGAAIVSIVFDIFKHEFDSSDCILEELSEIIVNLKKINFNPDDVLDSGNCIDACIYGKGVKFLSGDFAKFSNIKPLKDDIEIFTCNTDDKISFKVFVEKGFKYKTLEENRKEDCLENQIFLDVNFNIVNCVTYSVNPSSFLGKECFEKLEIAIETKNNIMTPISLLKNAINTIADDFENLKLAMEYSNEEVWNQMQKESRVEVIDHSSILGESVMSIDEISTRCKNSLKKANINFIGDLVAKSKKELCGIENLGKVSADTIQKYLKNRGLSLKPNVITNANVKQNNKSIEHKDNTKENVNDNNKENVNKENIEEQEENIENIEKDNEEQEENKEENEEDGDITSSDDGLKNGDNI